MMKKTISLISLLIVFAASQAFARQKVGLVLSGGGAKGIAHIGVIQALEENDIPIDYVTGTSMGAIVGGLYASGYSPAEMMELICSKDFSYWSTGTIDPDMRFYFTTPAASPRIVNLPLGNDSIAQMVPQSLIGPNAMNFPFMRLFIAQTALCKGDFNNLFVPLRTVSSNLKAQRGEVARGGDLTDAVRASMSFPLVFCPVEIDDTLHYDGGIFDNFPVDVMREEFHPDIMIGLDVHTDSENPVPNVINQVTNLAMRPQSYAVPEKEGIKIHMDLNNYSLLDFPMAREIYEIGYRKGLEMIDSIKERVTARTPKEEVEKRREEFKRRLPDLKFGDVECTGGTDIQNRYIVSQFRADGNPMSLEKARIGYYRAISSNQIADLKIKAIPTDSTEFDIRLKAYPKSPWSLDLGAYLSLSTTNMLYGALNYSTLSSRALNASVGAWIGENYMASQLLATIRFGGEHPYSLGLQGVVSNHNMSRSEKMFFQTHQPDYIRNFEAFGRADLISTPVGPHASAKLQIGYGFTEAMVHQEQGDSLRSYHSVAQLALRYDYNTLDAINFPVSGGRISSSIMAMSGRGHDRWLQLNVEAEKYWSMGRSFAVGASGHLLASGRKAPANVAEAVLESPVYSPTASSFNALNQSFHAYSFLGLGLNPIWKAFTNFQLRASLNLFVPWEKIGSDKKLNSAEFLGEATAVYSFKNVNLSAYINYRTGTPVERGVHAGLALGVFLPAPSFYK